VGIKALSLVESTSNCEKDIAREIGREQQEKYKLCRIYFMNYFITL